MWHRQYWLNYTLWQKVYTGTAQWDKCIAACDAIINSTKYALSPNYSGYFNRANTGNPEIIWAVPYDGVKAVVQYGADDLKLSQPGTYNINAQPWNGFATIQEFYQSYIDPVQNPGPQGTVVGLTPNGAKTTGTLDKRMLIIFLLETQFASNGDTLKDGGLMLLTRRPTANFYSIINQLFSKCLAPIRCKDLQMEFL